jgi:hypothetical protein
MTIFSRTRPAFSSEALCGLSADQTGFVEAWLNFWNGFAVSVGVTGNAQSYPIVNAKHQLRIVCNWLLMMGMNCYTTSAALLTGVIVSLINSIAPFLYASTSQCPQVSQRSSALPVWGRFSTSGTGSATVRTEFSIPAMTAPAKLFATMRAYQVSWKGIHRKVFAVTGAELRSYHEPKRFDGKGFPTLFAVECVHGNILPDLSFICNVIPALERMSQAFPELEIRRVDS